MSFKGTTPTLHCEEVSGVLGCKRPVKIGAPHCGIETHTVSWPDRAAGRSIANPEPPPIRRPEKKPKLFVNEDFDLVDLPDRGPDPGTPEAIALPDLVFASFQPELLQVGRRVQVAFTKHHRVSPEAAIEEIRLLVRTALEHGGYERSSAGNHKISYKGFRVKISPNGRMVKTYQSLHFERLPSQVFAGVPSRFRGTKNLNTDPPLTLTIDELRELNEIVVTKGALYAFAKSENRSQSIETRRLVRDVVRRAVVSGEWLPGRTEGSFVVTNEGRSWVIAASERKDGPVIKVITTWVDT